MVERVLVDEVQEYDKFLWLPKKIGFSWVWLKKVRVIEQYTNMLIDGKPCKIKKVEMKIKED